MVSSIDSSQENKSGWVVVLLRGSSTTILERDNEFVSDNFLLKRAAIENEVCNFVKNKILCQNATEPNMQTGYDFSIMHKSCMIEKSYLLIGKFPGKFHYMG